MAENDPRYELLEKLILSKYSVAIIESLCSEDFVSRQHEKKLSQAIVLYYNAKDKMASLLDWAIAREVRGAVAQPNTLFRSNTMSVRIIADHIRHIAPVYLVNTLHSVIHRVLEYAKPLEIDSTRTIDGKPVKQSEIRRRLAIIINFAELLLQAIFDSVTDCPKELRELMGRLYNCVTAQFPSQGSMAVGGFIFLRFFCPAVVSPQQFYLTDRPVPPEGGRVLLILSKILIQLANQTEFTDPALQSLNAFLSDKQMLVIDWLVKFSTDHKAYNKRNDDAGSDSEDTSDVSSSLDSPTTLATVPVGAPSDSLSSLTAVPDESSLSFNLDLPPLSSSGSSGSLLSSLPEEQQQQQQQQQQSPQSSPSPRSPTRLRSASLGGSESPVFTRPASSIPPSLASIGSSASSSSLLSSNGEIQDGEQPASQSTPSPSSRRLSISRPSAHVKSKQATKPLPPPPPTKHVSPSPTSTSPTGTPANSASDLLLSAPASLASSSNQLSPPSLNSSPAVTPSQALAAVGSGSSSSLTLSSSATNVASNNTANTATTTATSNNNNNSSESGTLGSGYDARVKEVSNEARQLSFAFIHFCLYQYRDDLYSRLAPRAAEKLRAALEAAPIPVEDERELMSAHDKHNQLIKHAVCSRQALNARFTLAIEGLDDKKKPSAARSKDRKKSVGRVRSETTTDRRVAREKEKEKDLPKEKEKEVSKDKDREGESLAEANLKIHNQLLLLRIKQLESMVFEATGARPTPAPYLTMYDKGALANADPALLAAYVAQASTAANAPSLSVPSRRSGSQPEPVNPPSATDEPSSITQQLKQLQSGLDEVTKLTKLLVEGQLSLADRLGNLERQPDDDAM